MPNLGLPVYTPDVYKKNRVFRQANGNFFNVKCGDCEELTLCYAYSQTDMKCRGCSAPILKSTGGRAKFASNKMGWKTAESNY